MQMLMIAFCSFLKERVHELLHQCGGKAFTEVNETVGYGQTGPADGLEFYPGTNSVILVSLHDEHVARVTKSVKAWCEEAAKYLGWQKPSLRIFSWPRIQVV
jgi:nitrogen regulatory protein PII